MKKVCITIPIHRPDLQPNEENALKRVIELYEKKYDILLVGPKGLNVDNYQIGSQELPLVPLPPRFFKNNFGYNTLLRSSIFYKPFLKYDYMLLYQLDAFIFEDRLQEVMDWGFDYIGAPWVEQTWMKKMDKQTNSRFFTKFFIQVGNGGFSLRKIKKAYRISIFLAPLKILWRKKWHEDLFWSTICYRLVPGYRVADLKKAMIFAIEDSPRECFKALGDELPFGCHAWEKHDPEFWIPQFEKFGYKMQLPT
ncbi:MAG: hypothetical protein KI790_02235 [Cyclobacteriaceae bacterium]|nr:hypothetical protein [Cyclobacteriaceae bacterium HetDA_MAG_MS6]